MKPDNDFPLPAPSPRRMVYLEALRYVFESPDCVISLVLLVVVGFLPVLGNVAQLGFLYEVIESLHRRPGAPYAKFDLRRFGDYCMRGVWPYVLAMTVWMILYTIFYLPMQLGLQFGLIGIMPMMRSNQQAAFIIMAVVGLLVMLVVLTVVIATAVLTAPMLLRAGLSQDFRLVFGFDWIKGYIRRMWADQIVTTLFLMVVTVVLLPLGCMVFLVGAIVVPIIVAIASSHLQWQLYEIYLERGGEPIPLHPLPAEAPPTPA